MHVYAVEPMHLQARAAALSAPQPCAARVQEFMLATRARDVRAQLEAIERARAAPTFPADYFAKMAAAVKGEAVGGWRDGLVGHPFVMAVDAGACPLQFMMAWTTICLATACNVAHQQQLMVPASTCWAVSTCTQPARCSTGPAMLQWPCMQRASTQARTSAWQQSRRPCSASPPSPA